MQSSLAHKIKVHFQFELFISQLKNFPYSIALKNEPLNVVIFLLPAKHFEISRQIFENILTLVTLPKKTRRL